MASFIPSKRIHFCKRLNYYCMTTNLLFKNIKNDGDSYPTMWQEGCTKWKCKTNNKLVLLDNLLSNKRKLLLYKCRKKYELIGFIFNKGIKWNKRKQFNFFTYLKWQNLIFHDIIQKLLLKFKIKCNKCFKIYTRILNLSSYFEEEFH